MVLSHVTWLFVAQIELDGRNVAVEGYEKGNFVGPTILSNVKVSLRGLQLSPLYGSVIVTLYASIPSLKERKLSFSIPRNNTSLSLSTKYFHSSNEAADFPKTAYIYIPKICFSPKCVSPHKYISDKMYLLRNKYQRF